MARNGYTLSEQEVREVIRLLSSTNLTFQEIAKRLRCGGSVVISINRKYQVREYGLKRSWTLGHPS